MEGRVGAAACNRGVEEYFCAAEAAGCSPGIVLHRAVAQACHEVGYAVSREVLQGHHDTLTAGGRHAQVAAVALQVAVVGKAAAAVIQVQAHLALTVHLFTHQQVGVAVSVPIHRIRCTVGDPGGTRKQGIARVIGDGGLRGTGVAHQR